MAIHFFGIDTTLHIKNKRLIKSWITEIIQNSRKKVKDVNIVFANDDYLKQLNSCYLKKNTLTDIITFNYNSSTCISGDLYISVERVKENSVLYQTTLSQELMRVIIHGILHLLGYDDKTEEQKKTMKQKEDVALNKVENLIII